MPMIHQSRFLAALELGSDQQPPLCLQYAIWCLAASISHKYENYCNLFYGRARKCSDAAEWEVSFLYIHWEDNMLREEG